MNILSHITPILSLIDPTKNWEKMTIAEWVDIILFDNSRTIKYLPMELLNGYQTARIIHLFPEKANDANINWNKLEGWDWIWLLRELPHLAFHCDWEKLSGLGWKFLLQEQPHFAIHRK